MKRIFIFIYCLIFSFACNVEEKKIDYKQKLSGKIFRVTNSISEDDIEFLDSTYISYGLILIQDKYRIENVNDTVGKLFFGNSPALIKMSNSSEYDYLVIGEKINDTLLLKEKFDKNHLENITGLWQENPKMFYRISENEIALEFNDSLMKKSDLRLDPSNQYLTFELNHSSNKSEHYWKIKEINADTLIIDKSFKTLEGGTTINNIKLIKKR